MLVARVIRFLGGIAQTLGVLIVVPLLMLIALIAGFWVGIEYLKCKVSLFDELE